MVLIEIPSEFGKGGANISEGNPRLADILQNHRTEIAAAAAAAAIPSIISLGGIDSRSTQLISYPTEGLLSGTRAWVERESVFFGFVQHPPFSFTADNERVVDGFGGGQWFREGFTLPVLVDPTVGGGLNLPIGTRVWMADSSAAWDKFGPGSNDWYPVGVDQEARDDAANASATAGNAQIGVLKASGQLPDANITIGVSPSGSFSDATHGTEFLGGPTTADRAYTVDAAGALPKETLQITLAQNVIGGHNLTFVNGGPAVGTLYVFPAADLTTRLAVFKFDGTDWTFDHISRIA